MARPVNEVEFWKERLKRAQKMGEIHRAVFECTLTQWRKIEEKHREILARHVLPGDSVLDAGCGWGRLLGLMPKEWAGAYLGVDLSPDFIALAKKRGGLGIFLCHDLLKDWPADISKWFRSRGEKLDWAIMISMRPMVKRELGGEVWDRMEVEIRKVAKKLLYLEYDPSDEGSIE